VPAKNQRYIYLKNMRKIIKIIIAALLFAIGIVSATIMYLPTNRVNVSSELIMLGDLNNDNRWNESDLHELEKFLKNPFMHDKLKQFKTDVNRNGLLDDEDIVLLKLAYKFQNPYMARDKAMQNQFPQPRELYRYLPTYEYIQQPLFATNHEVLRKTPFSFLNTIQTEANSSPYSIELLKEIYSEAVRFSFAFEMRKSKLIDIEKNYVDRKIQNCETLFDSKDYYNLLLELISLVEDAETLTITTQTDFIQKILYFRDNLKNLLVSKDYESFKQDKKLYLDIFTIIELHLKTDLNISIQLASLSSPRDFRNLKNYIDRAEWQVYKSKTTKENFEQLVLFAQYDRRYLRAVSKTSPKLEDIQLENHNLPMILLFREALRITNSKKAAVGLLDEAVRIPMGWVKSIPRELLPSSVALENFLLPGNKEDGSDKTRHWSVFGGVSIYKNPEEALILALQREYLDLKANNYSVEAMNEFLRDTIANINGIYYVLSINPNLLHEIEN
jgi:hypothetical protein